MTIRVEGASEHNLRDIDVVFEPGLTVVTGVSGSGKTSLVFDTLYQETRRRFLEVMSLDTAEHPAPPRVRAITGLGPAVAVGQNLLNRNPSSTVATASGLHPFFRLLYANLGERHCARCGAAVSVLSEDEIVARLVAWSESGALTLLAPLLRGARGSHRTLLAALEAELGREALRVDGERYRGAPLAATAPHDLDVALSRWVAPATVSRAREAMRAAEALGARAVVVERDGRRDALSRAPVCVACGAWFGDLTPTLFHTACPHCDGAGCDRCGDTGLHPEAAGVYWEGMRLPELLALSVEEARARLSGVTFGEAGERLRVEIMRRLEALDRVGLGYVSLDRPAPTLSRGEAQRLRLAVALTSRLEDMLHILDEPTIGQHPADVARLLPAFRELGGPVIYVEHDRAAAAEADHAIDLGPGAGSAGGRLLYSGTPAGLWRADTSTGRYFSLRERVSVGAGAARPRPAPERFLTLRGCHLRNLRDLDVAIPLGRLTAVTGVSGSGKSTLVEDVLVASLAAGEARGCRGVEGPALKPTIVDQDPIGHNPRSNPATYTKLADIIRDCFAAATGLSASHFSFNRPEGACPDCHGMGAIEVPMRYLPSTWITCQGCDGQRFSEEVLATPIACDGRRLSIAEFYDLPIAEAAPLLLAHEALSPSARRRAEGILHALIDVGLGYLSLGQPSPTLSGGEAQRVKLAKHLGARSLTGQLLVLDEPTTGLHPQDVAGLLVVLDRLVRAGATVVVVEHNADLIRAADWVIDLGPGAGPRGGRLLYAGPPAGLEACDESLTGRALREEATLTPRGERNHGDTEGTEECTAEARGESQVPGDRLQASAGERSEACNLSPATCHLPSRCPPCLRGSSSLISIRNARAHNLRGVSVDIPKGALTVVTGVSGSGKSSLVGDVLETEARRRFLESLSLYERQSTREGPEAPVDEVSGLGVAVTVSPERRLRERRATVGTATEISHHLAVLLAWVGERRCTTCGAEMVRETAWRCPACGAEAPIAGPARFSPRNYAAACTRCNGVGTLQEPRPEKLIIHPEKPLCAGAMYSPGFFPKGYLGKPYNGGYDMVQALAQRYGFDPFETPWNAMTPEAQHAFLFGTEEELDVTFRSRTGRVTQRCQRFPGFYGWIGDWDAGGTYTETVPCPACGGARLRPEYLAVTLGGHNVHALSAMPLRDLAAILDGVRVPERTERLAGPSLRTARRRLRFLARVGLGYLHLDRPASTLSAGEAQRLKLAGLLGSGLTSLTVLIDEPTRGLHPREVDALIAALRDLRAEGNTVIVVEHDPAVMTAADHLIDMGPGAGAEGGAIVAQGTPDVVRAADTITARWLRGERRADAHRPRRPSQGGLTIRGARGNNLRVPEAHIPLGMLVGVCGVSGSGKSTLIVDTLGRAVAPRRQTTSVAYEPVDPEAHDAIIGAPARAIVVDQSRAGLVSAASYLGLSRAIHALYAETPDARALGLDAQALGQRCSVCRGSGTVTMDMGFLPSVHSPCEACGATGYLPEAWEARLRDVPLPAMMGLTIDEVHDLLGAGSADGAPPARWASLTAALEAARRVGLGYLVLRQPGYALSGGEAQRLKIARELCRTATTPTLYILDEPTVGQHLEDVARLTGVLHALVEAGHSVLVVEHHPHLLAACDWLLELGPGGGPDGGRIVAEGAPEALAAGATATAPYLAEVLEASP